MNKHKIFCRIHKPAKNTLLKKRLFTDMGYVCELGKYHFICSYKEKHSVLAHYVKTDFSDPLSLSNSHKLITGSVYPAPLLLFVIKILRVLESGLDGFPLTLHVKTSHKNVVKTVGELVCFLMHK